jgi:hypothetical protein
VKHNPFVFALLSVSPLPLFVNMPERYFWKYRAQKNAQLPQIIQ